MLRTCEQFTINSLIASSYNLSLESTGMGGQLRSLCVIGCAAYVLLVAQCAAYESDEIQGNAQPAEAAAGASAGPCLSLTIIFFITDTQTWT